MVKLMTDGSSQGYSARIKWPGYVTGAPNGIWNMAPDLIHETVDVLHAAGVQMHVHVNGDEASEVVIDAIEAAVAKHGLGDQRHVLQHGQMIGAAQSLAKDPAVRAIVLRGEGRAFCAGLDKSNFGKMVETGKASQGDAIMDRSHGIANLFQYAGLVWRDMPVPVIAALQGVCIGGGMQLAMGADIRIAAPDCKLSILEMKWGLVPDMSGMVTFPRSIRGDVLRKLIYTNEMVAGAAAQEAGLVTEIADDPLARARSLAAEIASKSPSAMREAKALINAAEDEDAAEGLLQESRRQQGLIGGEDQRETVMAALEGRAADYG